MVKKLTTLALAILLTAAAFAADSTQVKKFTRWYAGVSITPGVSYRWLIKNKGLLPTYGPFRQEDVDTRNHNETPHFAAVRGLSLGLNRCAFWL